MILEVTVLDSSADRAADIAAALGAEFLDLVRELETPDGSESSPVKVTVTDRPEVPTAPSTPRTARAIGLGLVGGAFLGAAAALLRTRLDRTVRNAEELSSQAGYPMIGTIVRDESLGRQHVLDRSASTRVAEDYRQLRTSLQFLNVDSPPRVIMISSAMPAEGKTTLAIHLALALAEAGKEVVLVDADLRRPRIASYLGLVNGVGLTNILAGSAEVADVAQAYSASSITVIGAGPNPPNPSELLASKHMLELLGQLRDKYDFVIVDSPPVLPLADASGLAAIVDGVLLSVRYGQSRKDQVAQASTNLARVGAKPLGFVLSMVPPKATSSVAYGYGTEYGESGKHRG
ncbi:MULTISPECIES: CpsD/CapB family tyrosine-protein kinase [unclassified Blastococcus]|uniref:polysaccharide biosynthesis tyrosine autokinase n=1 Tax=unclassified Blastococcus TaxID=2619396 RepID=UPI001EF084B9|nr:MULTISPECIES: CpsD/CapB family tyrosine-protein kinase [unclassified Blastococcus]